MRKKSDVTCLISALDTTLKLPTPDRESPETEEEEKEEELQEKPVGADLPDGINQFIVFNHVIMARFSAAR